MDSKSDCFRVGVLAVEGFALMSYACTVEPLRAANLLSQKQLYEVVHIGEQTAIGSSGAAHVRCDFAAAQAEELDLVLVIAGGDPFSFDDREVLAWLGRLARRGRLVGGVSGGPVILANAGIMGGRRMTVHWEHAAMLEERFSDIIMERRLFVIDRDRVTCAGGAAPLDLMHALIADHHGSVFARQVSDWFLHTEIRAATSPQRGQVGERVETNSFHVVEAVTAMESHIADPLSLPQIALFSGISPRQLNRVFASQMGVSVMDHYRAMRLSVGRRLVRQSALRLDEIADATGFANAGHFSNAYKTEFGLRPKEDRGGGRRT